MNLKTKKITFPEIFIFIAILAMVGFIHYALFMLHSYYSDHKNSKQPTITRSDNIKTNYPGPSAIKTPKIVVPAKKPQIYSYVDSNGIKHFSNKPPRQKVKDLQTTKEYVSDNLGASEIIATRLNSRPSPTRTTRVVIRGNQVLVPVKLGYKGIEAQTMLLFDTGASTTMIHQEVATRLDLRNQKRSYSTVADGRTVPIKLATLDYIIVGPHKFRNFQTTIMDRQGEKGDYLGLLGMNFLRNAQYKINFSNSTITWN